MKLNYILIYIERVLIAVSILFNVLLGGPSNQTFSARNYRRKLDGKLNLVWLIDGIFFWDPDHCFHAWIYFKTTKNLRKKYIKNKNMHQDIYKGIYAVHDEYYE